MLRSRMSETGGQVSAHWCCGRCLQQLLLMLQQRGRLLQRGEARSWQEEMEGGEEVEEGEEEEGATEGEKRSLRHTQQRHTQEEVATGLREARQARLARERMLTYADVC